MNILSLFWLFTWLILRPTLPIVTIDWYPINSDATKIVNYWYNNSSWDIDMVATFICENGWFDTKAISKTHDYWLCQLSYRYNKEVINNPIRLSWRQYQAQICLDKWKAVENKNLRSCYRIRKLYMDKIKIWTKQSSD